MAQTEISRRALFARLIGRRPERTDRPAQSLREQTLIETYLGLLDRHRDALAFGVPEGDLPATPDEIRTALVDALPPEPHPVLHQTLREAYGSLAWFTSGDEQERLLAGRRALESSDQSDAGKNAIIEAFAIRAGKVEKMAALEKEFEERIETRPVADAPGSSAAAVSTTARP